MTSLQRFIVAALSLLALGIVGTSARAQANGGAGEAEFQAGGAALTAKDYGAAERHWTAACTLGSATGCLNLAIMNNKGMGIAQDKPKAATLFLKGCDLGEAQACAAVGVGYANGDGVAKNEAQATVFYEKACDRGLAAGCFATGTAYYKGEVVAKDEGRALGLFEKACAGRFAAGCSLAGLQYERQYLKMQKVDIVNQIKENVLKVCKAQPSLPECAGVKGATFDEFSPQKMNQAKAIAIAYFQKTLAIEPDNKTAKEKLATLSQE